MTKKQLKEKYTNWNVGITGQYWGRKEEIFKELQDLSYEACGKRYCSIEMNLKEALKTDNAWRALDLYNEYWKIQGAWDSMAELAISTENFKI